MSCQSKISNLAVQFGIEENISLVDNDASSLGMFDFKCAPHVNRHARLLPSEYTGPPQLPLASTMYERNVLTIIVVLPAYELQLHPVYTFFST